MTDEEIIEGTPEATEEAIQDKGDIFDEYFDNEEIIEGTPEESSAIEEIIEGVSEEVEPLIIETKGRWVNFEEITQNTFEVGKTYHIKVGGVCRFMISKNKPKIGLKTNEIEYTKDEENILWIKTR